jgi:hypothetical protein
MDRNQKLRKINLYLFICVYLRLSAFNNSIIHSHTEYGKEKKGSIYFSLAVNKSPGEKAPFSVIIAVIKSAGVTSKAGL